MRRKYEVQGIKSAANAVTRVSPQRNEAQVWEHGPVSEMSEMDGTPRLGAAECSASVCKMSEMGARRTSTRTNILHQKGGKGKRETRKNVSYTETPRALKARARPAAAGRKTAGVRLLGSSHRCVV